MSWPEGGKRLPLWDAIYNGDAVAAQKLLVTKAGADQVNTPHGLWQQTSVHVAVQHGHVKLLKHLVFTGANVNARTINGSTPLHLAVEINRRDIVQDLLLAGANPLLYNLSYHETVQFTGQTPLQAAVSRGLNHIATLLRQGLDSRQTLASLETAAQQTAKRRQSLLSSK
ncbi:Ankyrin repeats (3 copies) [Phytophthora infestans]|uniref:Ankyrin repeats (3 copies) n=1 Tax=Phytophthora infestans TaxID=4787 RepID=A0A833WE32_PHYIN|nr:Ankyrin repeats (3 copies) [Phytophthora infestans]KAF4140678.1 Ankyrin repeats domain-containing protein [Phytophthora infestans]